MLVAGVPAADPGGARRRPGAACQGASRASRHVIDSIDRYALRRTWT
jgi:hypothetical protein